MKRCRICRREFEPRLSTQACCSPNCAIAYARAQPKAVAKTAAKLVRQEKREAREKLKSLRDLLHEAQRHVNRYIRLRDEPLGCISCHMPASYGGQWQAGHYRTTAAAAHLRFNEDNIHKQCSQCNNHKSGNVAEYRKRLVERIGVERVEALENDNRTHKWTRDEVLSITRIYRAKCREFERERA